MMVDGKLIYADEGTIATAYNRMGTVALAGHANYSLSFHRLTVNAGARTELIWSDVKDYMGGDPSKRFVPAVMPGAGVYYDMIPGWGILSGIYRGFSPPAPGSADDVKPEYSTNVEAGTRYNRAGLRLEAVGFLNEYKNMTDVCTLASGCLNDNLDRQFDAGKARIYGVEVFGSYELELPYDLSVPASVAYTFSHGEFLNSFESEDPIYGNVTKGDEMPYLPPHQLNATLALEHRYAGVNASVNYVAHMREVAGRGELVDADSTDTQFWLDVGVFARPLRWLTIYGNVRNVTAEKNLVSRRPYGARVNAPRWVQCGVKAEF
jgi:Fe(3+) dicitrate transport protein